MLTKKLITKSAIKVLCNDHLKYYKI